MVHLVPRSALHTTKEGMERVRAWIETNIPGAELPDVTVVDENGRRVSRSSATRGSEEGLG